MLECLSVTVIDASPCAAAFFLAATPVLVLSEKKLGNQGVVLHPEAKV